MIYNFAVSSERRIEKAKIEQAKRLGQSGAFGKRKRCLKGKSCGASCIAGSKVCLVDLPWVGQVGMKKLVETIKSLKKPESVKPKEPTKLPSVPSIPSVQSNPSITTEIARDKVEEIINRLNTIPSILKVDGRLVADKVNWDAAYLSGSQALGEGSFGAFVAVPNKNLGPNLDRFSSGVGVKAGQIGAKEAEIIKRAGANKVGPELIAAKIDKDFVKDSWGYVTAEGLIAMSRVPGKPLYKTQMGAEDVEAFWKSRATLHAKAGIAHNDMHGGNALVDKSSKGTSVKFVDFGLASTNPKAVLVEALGGVTEKDYQLVEKVKTGSAFGIVKANFQRVEKELKKDGFSEQDLKAFFVTKIRLEESLFNDGPWGRMTDAQAKKYVNMLYQGVLD